MNTANTEMTKGIKSSHKYFVAFDKDTKKINFKNDLTTTSTIKNSNMIESNEVNMFSKVSSLLNYIFLTNLL